MRIRRNIILTFTIAAVLLAHAAPGRAQTASPVLSDKDLKRIEKVKRDLADIGVGNTITVSRLDNRDFFGRVKTIGTDDFEIVIPTRRWSTFSDLSTSRMSVRATAREATLEASGKTRVANGTFSPLRSVRSP